jgi:hypothetical protein
MFGLSRETLSRSCFNELIKTTKRPAQLEHCKTPQLKTFFQFCLRFFAKIKFSTGDGDGDGHYNNSKQCMRLRQFQRICLTVQIKKEK